MIEAAIFDMDGVIIDSEPIHDVVSTQFYEENGRPVTREDLNSMRGIPPMDTIKRFLPHITDPQELQRLHERRVEILTQAFRDNDIPLVDGVLAFMKKLREENVRIAVATSTQGDVARQILEKVGALEFVEVLVGGEEVKEGKPAPDIFLKAAEHLGVDPSHCVVFEDSPVGVEAGRRAHMLVVALLTTHKRQDIPEAHEYVQDFTEVNMHSLSEKTSLYKI